VSVVVPLIGVPTQPLHPPTDWANLRRPGHRMVVAPFPWSAPNAIAY
jgi:hypothetical protein